MGRNLQAEVRSSFLRGSLRATPRRYAVLEQLLRSSRHLTAEQVFAGVNRAGARASRATVYNSLHALVRAGIVQEVKLGDEAVRYDTNSQWHHHFICDRCGRLEDISGFEIPDAVWRARLGPRAVRSFQIVFRGACERCSKRNSSNTVGRKNSWEKSPDRL